MTNAEALEITRAGIRERRAARAARRQAEAERRARVEMARGAVAKVVQVVGGAAILFAAMFLTGLWGA